MFTAFTYKRSHLSSIIKNHSNFYFVCPSKHKTDENKHTQKKKTFIGSYDIHIKFISFLKHRAHFYITWFYTLKFLSCLQLLEYDIIYRSVK